VLPSIEGLAPNYTTLSFVSNLQYFTIGVLAFQILKAASQRQPQRVGVVCFGFIATTALFFAAVLTHPAHLRP
jgi:hypothetical protein